MQLLIIKLAKEELLEDLLTALTASGLDTACIVDSSSIQKFMGQRIPIFAGLRTEMDHYSYCKVIIARILYPESLEEFRRLLKRSNIDFDDLENGTALLIPCEEL